MRTPVRDVASVRELVDWITTNRDVEHPAVQAVRRAAFDPLGRRPITIGVPNGIEIRRDVYVAPAKATDEELLEAMHNVVRLRRGRSTVLCTAFALATFCERGAA